ncbi:hypothetical protein CBR_g37557 [Chara braunii]|uniref:Uncharacterized protein n=1 Tax=Chara braunii TaxID=69332 RepID=A0A388LN32_CHABU|nr:hypothetical protein CBR_g37557 [Chara braunii]|eukprot:GBG83756.1 hypothetical protein CBR_g37557 [Chara braunii]
MRRRMGDDVEYHPMEAGRVESTEELHALIDREEEQLRRDWDGKQAYMAQQRRIRDLETGAPAPAAGGVDQPVPIPTVDAQYDVGRPPSLGHTDVDSGSAMGRGCGASEYGDPVVSNVIVGLCVAGTFQSAHGSTQKAVDVEGDSNRLVRCYGLDVEDDARAGGAGRPVVAMSSASTPAFFAKCESPPDHVT